MGKREDWTEGQFPSLRVEVENEQMAPDNGKRRKVEMKGRHSKLISLSL